MRVPDFVLKCVGFVCPVEHRDSGGVPSGDPQATGFFVSVPGEHPKLKAQQACAVYFVTAKHVLDGLKNQDLFFSVNKIGGGKTTIEGIIGDRWWYHPVDKTADVAVAQVWPSYDADLVSVSIEQLGTPEVLTSVNIGIGDEVYSTGLFLPVNGAHRNIPILRQGNLAMMPAEQCPFVLIGRSISTLKPFGTGLYTTGLRTIRPDLGWLFRVRGVLSADKK